MQLYVIKQFDTNINCRDVCVIQKYTKIYTRSDIMMVIRWLK